MSASETTSPILQPRAVTARTLGVSARTLKRWESDSRVAFPAPVRVRGLAYYSPAAVAAWVAARGQGGAA
jgi:hypothetical protein